VARLSPSVIAMTTDVLTAPARTSLVSRTLLLRFVSIIGSAEGAPC
jgi:hypothetical protein